MMLTLSSSPLPKVTVFVLVFIAPASIVVALLIESAKPFKSNVPVETVKFSPSVSPVPKVNVPPAPFIFKLW
ncbi:hypothetical protein ES705_32741 [subsurface metagenome]